jgi:imidazolonepropionase-like amidohydrolase
MSPAQALVATTSEAARLLGVDHDRGTIEAGKRADLVVLGGSLDDMTGLADRVLQVWKDGQRVAGKDR